MHRILFSLAAFALCAGCQHVHNPALSRDKSCKPPLNCLGNSYDGAYSGCYRPPGPFWCCMPGPCATCRDPWLAYYMELGCYKFTLRPVCNDTSVPGDPPPAVVMAQRESGPIRVAYEDDDDDSDE